MPSTRRTLAWRAWVAGGLIAVGLAAWALSRFQGQGADLPYRAGGTPTSTVAVSRGTTYSLAVPGGVAAMRGRGVPVTGDDAGQQVISLQCRYSTDPASVDVGSTLRVTPEPVTTKAENTVGHFAAPVTGTIAVQCAGWGAMFVPDSDARAADVSGALVLLAVLALTVGGGLALSELYRGERRTVGTEVAVTSSGGPAPDRYPHPQGKESP